MTLKYFITYRIISNEKILKQIFEGKRITMKHCNMICLKTTEPVKLSNFRVPS